MGSILNKRCVLEAQGTNRGSFLFEAASFSGPPPVDDARLRSHERFENTWSPTLASAPDSSTESESGLASPNFFLREIDFSDFSEI